MSKQKQHLLVEAEEYRTEHPEEFTKLTQQQTISKILTMHTNGQIKFNSEIVKQNLVPDDSPQSIKDAAHYVEKHPKEFADVPEDIRVQRAFFLHWMGKLKYDNEK